MEDTLQEWQTQIDKYQLAVKAYFQEVSHIGIRVYGPTWTYAEDYLSKSYTASGAIMQFGDSLEYRVEVLKYIADIAQDEKINKLTIIDMSRSYSENLRSLARKIKETYKHTLKIQNVIFNTIKLQSESVDLDALEANYRATNRLGFATEIYVNTLLCVNDKKALTMLDSIADVALNIEPDTIAAAEEETQQLSKYHPLQQMLYSPKEFVLTDVTGQAIYDNITVLNLRNPQLTVNYKLYPLIDKEAVIKEFGPMATVLSGLSYKIVERLRTIQVTNITEPSPDRVYTPPKILNVGQPLYVTTDDCKTIKKFMPLNVDAKKWMPLAGSRPRVEKMRKLVSNIIMAEVNADNEIGWNTDIRKAFEDSVRDNPVVLYGEDAIVRELVWAFELIYDLEPPTNILEFLKMALPDKFTFNNYIVDAIKKLESTALDGKLQDMRIRSHSSLLPFNIVSRESRITNLIAIIDIAKNVWKSLTKKSIMIDLSVFQQPPLVKRAILIKIMKSKIIESLKLTPVECSTNNLKLYSLFR